MQCPKCGTENPDGTNICGNCGFVLISVAPTATSQHSRTSEMAIASLVLGLLSFFTFFLTYIAYVKLPTVAFLVILYCSTFYLTVPLAVIFGITSLIMISRSHRQLKGKGIAIAGIVFPIAILPFLPMLMGIMNSASEPTIKQQFKCGANMSSLGKAMLLYANDCNGKFPTSSEWCDLLIKYTDVNNSIFHCAGAFGYRGTCRNKGFSDKLCNYAINKNVEELGTKAPADMVLIFETNPGWNQSGGPEILSTENHQGDGCMILLNNGNVRFVRAEDVNGLRWTAGP